MARGHKKQMEVSCLGPPARCPSLPLFLRQGSLTEIDYRKKIGYPYSNLSTGGPSWESLNSAFGNIVKCADWLSRLCQVFATCVS